jgi:hypothetical protein
VAQYDRVIPPGGEGKISLKINTRGYRGNVSKRARIYTNEPGNRYQAVSIQVFVKVPIYVTSRHVYLRGPADRKVTATVTVKGDGTKDLKLEETEFTLSEKITYTIEEVESGKLYRIHFVRLPGEVGMYRGILRLKTTYPEKPELPIRLTAQFYKVSEPQKN